MFFLPFDFYDLIEWLRNFIMRSLYTIPAIIIALTVHEFAHSLVSYKLGDYTAKAEGRLSLNPLRHIDPIGFIFLLIFRIGWAKPVPVRTHYYNKPFRDLALTALSGPASNMIFAFLCIPFLSLAFYTGNDIFITFMMMLILINIGLAVFNMIPIPPLDGSRIILWLLPQRYKYRFMQYEQFGFIVILVLFYIGALDIINRIVMIIFAPVWTLSNTLAIILSNLIG